MIQRILDFGMVKLFSGARQGRPFITGMGAALALFGWMRKRRGPSKERIYGKNLAEGETIQISFRRGEMTVDETKRSG